LLSFTWQINDDDDDDDDDYDDDEGFEVRFSLY